MKKLGLICVAALMGMTLTACDNSSSQKSTKISSSSSSTKSVQKHKSAKKSKQEKRSKVRPTLLLLVHLNLKLLLNKVSNQLSKKFKLTLPNHKAKLIVNVVTIQTVLHYYLVKTMPPVRILMVPLMPGYKAR
nr:hypothetical protein [Limosilactobacillus mucosae]